VSATRTEREQELEERGRRNEVMVRSTKVLHQQFLKKDRPEIRAGSPEREEKALEQHFQTSAETRKRKRTAEDPEYDGYLKLARSGAPTDVSTVGDAKKKAVAQQANQEGQRQFAQDRVIGSTDALTANLSLDQSLATIGRPAGYLQGFSETLQRRSDAAAAGYMDGLNNDPVALPVAADPVVALRLTQDYVACYNKGKAEAALGMVT